MPLAFRKALISAVDGFESQAGYSVRCGADTNRGLATLVEFGVPVIAPNVSDSKHIGTMRRPVWASSPISCPSQKAASSAGRQPYAILASAGSCLIAARIVSGTGT